MKRIAMFLLFSIVTFTACVDPDIGTAEQGLTDAIYTLTWKCSTEPECKSPDQGNTTPPTAPAPNRVELYINAATNYSRAGYYVHGASVYTLYHEGTVATGGVCASFPSGTDCGLIPGCLGRAAYTLCPGGQADITWESSVWQVSLRL